MRKSLPDIISVTAVCIISLFAALFIVLLTPVRIILQGEPEVTIGINSTYTEPGAKAVRSLFDKTDTIEITDNINTAVPGSYEVIYSVKDRRKTRTATRTVTVKDLIAPVISLNGSDKVEIYRLTDFTDPGVTANDDIDGDLTDKVQRVLRELPEKGGDKDTGRYFEYVYSVTDSAGNKKEVSRQLLIKRAVKESDVQPDGTSFICLTFDDGPDIKTTDRILDILTVYGVKATFFICDYDESEKALVQRIIKDGHTLAIHSKSHDYSYIYSSPENFMQELEYMKNKIFEDTGYEAKIIRFPGGSSNTVSSSFKEGIMTDLAQRVHAAGYEYIDWNVDSGDANGNGIHPDRLCDNFREGIKHDRTNIVLMHDTAAKSTTAEALPRMIEYGINSGYTFKRITEDTPPAHHKIFN